jgi:hypothetical protein
VTIFGRRVRIFPTLMGLATVAFMGWCAGPSPPPDPACTADPELRVNLGDRLFAVPRDYLPSIYVDTGSGLSLLASPICQRPDSPIETKAFSIEPGRQPYFEEDARTRPIWRVQVYVRDRVLPHRAPRDAYSEALRYIESAGVEPDELPRQQGFIAFDSPERGRHVYIALPGTIASLDDAPVVIDCSAPPLRSPAGTYFGRPCRTSYYAVSDAAVVRYKFYDGRYPIATWGKLDADVREFVRSMQTREPRQ